MSIIKISVELENHCIYLIKISFNYFRTKLREELQPNSTIIYKTVIVVSTDCKRERL